MLSIRFMRIPLPVPVRLWFAEKIPFADLDSFVTQDVVRRRDVKEEIRKGEIGHEIPADEIHLALWKFKRDGPVFRAVELLARHAFQIIDRLGNARLELRKGGLGIGEARRLQSGKTRGG